MARALVEAGARLRTNPGSANLLLLAPPRPAAQGAAAPAAVRVPNPEHNPRCAGHASLSAKTRLQLTPLLCAVSCPSTRPPAPRTRAHSKVRAAQIEKRKVQTAHFLADAQRPPFVLPTEPEDLVPRLTAPSRALSAFLRTLPPRPAQALRDSEELRAALGPRGAPVSPPGSPRGARRLSAVQAARAAALAQRKALADAGPDAPLRAAAAQLLGAAARRAAARASHGVRRGAALLLVAAAARGAPRRGHAGLVAARSAAAGRLAAACRRAAASECLRGAVTGGRVISASAAARTARVRGAAQRSAAGALQARLRAGAARAAWVHAAGEARALLAEAAAVLASAVLRRHSAAALSALLAAGAALAAAVGRSAAQRSAAAEAAARRALQARARAMLAVESLQQLRTAYVAQRCSVLERRRSARARQPSWRREARPPGSRGADAAAGSPPDAAELACLWLPLFPADDCGGAGADTQPRGGGRGESIEEEVTLAYGMTVRLARPLSANPARRAAPRAADEVLAVGVPEGRPAGRPATSGRSGRAEAGAGAAEVARRWREAAENVLMFDDAALAAAAVESMISGGGRWVSDGMKCWLAHCVARRCAGAGAAGAGGMGSRAASDHGSGPASERSAGSPDGPSSESFGPASADETRSGMARLEVFLEERAARRAEAAAGGATSGVSERQRLATQLHLGFMRASVGEDAAALKLFTAARKALEGIADGALPSPAGPGAEPPWPSLLSPPGGADAGVGARVEGRAGAVLAVAQANCAVCLLRLGAAEQALPLAAAAAAGLAAAPPLAAPAGAAGAGAPQDDGLPAALHQRLCDASDAILRAARAANGLKVEARAAECLEISDSDDAEEEEAPGGETAPGPRAAAACEPAGWPPLGRLGRFPPDRRLAAGAGAGAGAGAEATPRGLQGSARMSTAEVAHQVASLLDDAWGAAPPSPRVGGAPAPRRFGENGATWRLSHSRPLSSGSHNRTRLGFNTEVAFAPRPPPALSTRPKGDE